MVQEFVDSLPATVASWVLTLAVLGAVFGVALWLAGSQFSRSLLTLIAVAVGASAGVRMPRWFGWPIDAWATAVGGALVSGVLAYVLHRLSVGIALGFVLAGWAGVATWSFCKTAHPPADPVDGGGVAVGAPAGAPDSPEDSSVAPRPGPWRAIAVAWDLVPAAARQALPFACGSALVAGVALALLWPRVALVLLYSSAGVSLAASLGVAVVAYKRREWLRLLPAQASTQILVLLGLVAFGALVQWKTAPSAAKAAAASGKAGGTGGKTSRSKGSKPMGRDAED